MQYRSTPIKPAFPVRPNGGTFVDRSHLLAQPHLIHAANLIEQDPCLFSLKKHFGPTTHGLTDSGDRRNDDTG
jgi:hypothetical protein